MARIHIGGAGGAPSNNVIRSLRESGRHDRLIGTSSSPADLLLADVDERYVVPTGDAPSYRQALLGLIEAHRPDFIHVQNDIEVLALSRLRHEVVARGTTVFLPAAQTVETCVDKYASYAAWRDAGVRVPETLLVSSPADLDVAFDRLGPDVWLRATVGGGGYGALPTQDRRFAQSWIDTFSGWGHFTAARRLTPDSVTWSSIWFEGALVVAQSRRRRSWNFGSRTVSGVTGVTGVAETLRDPVVDSIAETAIRAIDPVPHGIFSVDMTYDHEGVANPTEINIGRFFTTIYFFTRAGLNMPAIYRDLALGEPIPSVEPRINPLPPGLVWVRGMDVEPVLTTIEELDQLAMRTG